MSLEESAKTVRISDLLYDTVQEAAMEHSQAEESRRVCRVESSPDDDRGQADIDAALDDQALDLGHYRTPIFWKILLIV